MDIGYGGFFGILVLAGDIWAILNIAQSGASNGKKLLWILHRAVAAAARPHHLVRRRAPRRKGLGRGMFETTIAGSLPKPGWLAEDGQAVARVEGRKAPRWQKAKRDATLLWLKEQEDAGIDIVTDGEQSRQHFVHGFLEFVEGIDFEHKVKMGIRNNRYDAMVPVVVGPLKLKGRVHQTEARVMRNHSKRKIKITLPGPMTIVDTIADRHYGDKVKLAMAFAELLNQEARALEKDGVDVIQFDEPAFNVYMERRHQVGHRRAARRDQGTEEGQDRRAHLLRLRHQGEPRLEGNARRRVAPVRADLPGAGQEQARPGVAGVHPLARAGRADEAAQGQGRAGRRDRRRVRQGRNAGRSRENHRTGAEIRAEEAPLPLHQLRHGADEPRDRGREAEGARRGRGAGAKALPLTLPGLSPLPLPPGIRSRQVPGVNGLEMHLLEAGDENRPALLLLHGFPELAYSWRKVMLPLAQAGYRVLAPDQRGYGRTTGWDGRYDGDLASFRLTNLVRDAVQLLIILKINSVESVIGHDFGSPVAAWCALLHPEIFRSVALMSAPFSLEPPATATPPPDPVHDELAALARPRKHYQWYYSTREANRDMLAARRACTPSCAPTTTSRARTGRRTGPTN